MKMRRKRWTAFLIVGILCFSLTAGCSGGNGAVPTEEPQATPIALDPPADVTLPDTYGYREILEAANAKTAKNFYEKTGIIAMKVNMHYGFSGLVMHELQGSARTALNLRLGDRIYTTARFLGRALDFTVSRDGDQVTFEKEGTKIVFTVSQSTVSVNGTAYAAYEAMAAGDDIFIDAGNFAAIIGFESRFDASSGILLLSSPDRKADEETDPVAIYRDRYELYENAVFHPEDPVFDATGVGLYDPVDPSERLVGIAYTTWSWTTSFETWDTPLLGRYLSNNRDVIYQHGVWLAEAGVDFVFVDWSNNVGYDPETMRKKRQDFRMIEDSVIDLFEVWATIPNAPKIAIFTGPGHVQEQEDTFANGKMQAKNNQIYETFIENPEYNKMYFYYEGKPLLLCYGATPSFVSNNEPAFTDDRFTTRWVTGYVGQQGNLYDSGTMVSYMHWSWEERGAQTFTVYNDRPEAMTVVASWRKQGEEGNPGYIAPGLRDDGATFRMQWARADAVGVRIALVVSFNEWHIGEQVSLENSKDIEPSETYGTLYLDIMREQIRRFKS